MSALVCLIITAGPPAAAASDVSASEYAVKAAILYKITKFVNWPDDAFAKVDDDLSICLAKDSPFGSAMQSLHGRSVRGRNIRVIRIGAFDRSNFNCQIIFIGQADEKKARTILSQITGQPILTVGEGDSFVERGGIISLQVEKSHVSFAINIKASNQAGLDISAQLLQLATIIEGDGG